MEIPIPLVKQTPHSSDRNENGSNIVDVDLEVEDHDLDHESVHEEHVDDIKISPLHRKLLDVIKSSTLFIPTHVEIRNESYWYSMRAKLHPRRHLALIARQNPTNLRWESFFYKMKPREEDLEIVPQKQFITTHKSRWAAYKNSEAACRERDANPVFNKKLSQFIDPSNLLSTHFRILVVSETFYRLPNIERIALIYETLLDKLGVQLSPAPINTLNPRSKQYQIVNPKFPAGGLAQCSPLRLKLGSTFGSHMCSLQLFRVFLPDGPLSLIIEAKTPGQWKPDIYILPASERIGSSHMDFRSLEVASLAKPKANKFRVKQLGRVTTDRDSFLPNIHEKTSMAQGYGSVGDSIGLTSLVSGIKFKKTGGVYGHFFNDLSPGIKALIMGKFKENKVMIQREGSVSVDKKKKTKRKENTPMTGLAMLRSKVAMAALGAYDKGTASETEMLQEVYIAAKLVERAVIRLQRIRRLYYLPRAVRLLWRRKYACLTIQRVVRGRFGRLYAALLRKIMPIASIRIQRAFRAYKSRVIVARWRWTSNRLTRYALPKIKRFLRNCYLSWMARHFKMAQTIQAMIRMHICRNRYYRMLGERFIIYGVVDNAAMQIQRIVRGCAGRKKHASMFEAVLVARIDNPSATRIQRCFRGRLGRLKAKRCRKERRCAQIIQRCGRKYLARQWALHCEYLQLLEDCALKIQRMYRGRLDRERFEKKRTKWRFDHVLVPAIIKIQGRIRMFCAKKRVVIMLLRNRAAVVIQLFYRKYLKRLAIMARWRAMRLIKLNVAATVMQKYIRRYTAQLRYRRIWLSHSGRTILAGKVILRAWVNFKHAKRLQLLLDEHRVTVLARKVLRVKIAREELELDLKEVKEDIELSKKALQRNKERIEELEIFLAEGSLRLPAIQLEIASLSPDDYERGWAEACFHEYESLNNQTTLAREELRLQKHYTMKRTKEMLELRFELEEVEVELDYISTIEIETMEALRRSETGRIERKVNDAFNRMLRRERCQWKVDSTRVKVIQRGRRHHQEAIANAKLGRDMAYAQTLSYEKRKQRVDLEELIIKKQHQAEGMRQESDFQGYEQYAGPIQNTYNEVVSSTLSLLRNSTLDERAGRIRQEFIHKELQKKKFSMGQFGPLKPEYEAKEKSAMDKMREGF